MKRHAKDYLGSARVVIRSSMLMFVAAGLVGCGAEEPAGEVIEPLEPTSITVDGTQYQVTRSARTVDGKTTEGWSVVYEGLAVSCPQPTKLSCTNALRDFRNG